MNKLGKNKFLTGMAVVFAVAAAGWGLLVLPANSAASGHTEKINAAIGKINKELADLPGDQNVKVWSDEAESLKKRYGKKLKDLLDRDQALGQWFDGIDDNSTFAAFMTPYDDQRQALEKELLDKGVELGSPIEDKDGKLTEPRTPGFNWIRGNDITRADTHEKEMQAKEMLQKRFNICRSIVNAVTADVEKGKTSRRLLDVTFLEKFPFLQMSSGVAPESKSYAIPVDLRRYAGYTGAGGGSGYTEQLLPSNGDEPPTETDKSGESAAAPAKKPGPHLGKTLTFGFAVVMDYHHLPTLVRNLIDPQGGSELNVLVTGLSVFVHDPNPEEKVETVKLPVGGDPKPIETRMAQQTESCPPPQVHVYITCQVFDFDPAAIPAFLKP